jgi:hypothetical protein
LALTLPPASLATGTETLASLATGTGTGTGTGTETGTGTGTEAGLRTKHPENLLAPSINAGTGSLLFSTRNCWKKEDLHSAPPAVAFGNFGSCPLFRSARSCRPVADPSSVLRLTFSVHPGNPESSPPTSHRQLALRSRTRAELALRSRTRAQLALRYRMGVKIIAAPPPGARSSCNFSPDTSIVSVRNERTQSLPKESPGASIHCSTFQGPR